VHPECGEVGYPAETSATGLLKRVLENGELRVAGVQWSKGKHADYNTDPENTTGFWPEFMTDIVQKLSAHYNKPITLKRVYYVSYTLVGHAVANGDDDMSEPSTS